MTEAEWAEARDKARERLVWMSQQTDLSYEDRRKILRDLAYPVLEHALTDGQVEDVLNASPLVGDAVDQIDLRRTHAGLRDQLSERALWAIAARVPYAVTEMVAALIQPEEWGVKAKRGKTGYEFGSNEDHFSVSGCSIWCADILARGGTLGREHGRGGVTMSLDAYLSGGAIVRGPGYTASGGKTTTATTTTHTKKGETTMTKHDLSTAGLSIEHMANNMVEVSYDLTSLHSSELVVMLSGIAQQMGGKPMMEQAGKVLAAIGSDDASRNRIVDGILPYALGQDEDDMIDMDPGANSIFDAMKATSGDDVVHVVRAAELLLSKVSKVMDLTSELVGAAEGKKAGPKLLLKAPSGTEAELMNMVLAKAGMPEIGKIVDMLNSEHAKVEDAKAQAERAERKLAEHLMKAAEAKTALPKSGKEKASGVIPEGEFKMVPAWEAFELTKAKEMFSFEVPKWTWKGQHPLVPEVNPNYVFRPKELFTLLMGLVSNDPTYLHGHTGTGKTTLVEQVAAVLGYPFMRLNFDSEISRMDLIGRDTLVSDGGTTISKFVDGIVPQMMQSPCLACFDEIDFVRADVSYVLQRVLENDALVLTEDGGRVVHPHPMFRIFATGNTTGQGDEFGMYQGARPQSLALLDRFTNWIHVDYLPAHERMNLIKAAAPGLKSKWQDVIGKYVNEHLTAFKDAKVLQPLSPRGYMALAAHCAKFVQFYPDHREVEAIRDSFDATVLARATSQDRAVMRGLMDRLVK